MISKIYFADKIHDSVDVKKECMDALNDYQIARAKNSAYRANCWSMWLMSKGKAWEWEEQAVADKKGISLITYNVSGHFMKQKRALIINTETPVDFEVEKEGTTGVDEATKARTMLSYCFSRSSANVKLENACDGFLVVGQHLLIGTPTFEGGSFYMKIEEYPFYRYVPLSRSNTQFWEDITGVALIDIVPVSQIMMKYNLTKEQARELLGNRYTSMDILNGGKGFAGLGYASTAFNAVNDLMQDERMKEYTQSFDYGLEFADVYRENLYKSGDIAVLTLIERELEPRKVLRLSKTKKKWREPSEEDATNSAEYLKTNPPPNYNYIIKDYFLQELKGKDVYEDMKQDVKNGYLTITEVEMFCFRRRSFYGKYFFTEEVYPTEVPPYAPLTKEFTNDHFSRGDMDEIYDIQRNYNERQTRINNLMAQKALGKKKIFNGAIRQNDPQAETQLRDVYSSEAPFGFLELPPNVEQAVITEIDTEIDPEYVRNTYQMPSQMMDIIGITPYILGSGGNVSRTTADANNRATFGSATIKSDAMRFYTGVAIFGKRLLTYIKMFAPPNMSITSVAAGKQNSVVYNSLEINPVTLKPQIVNQLDFDSTMLRVSFRGSEFSKDSAFEQKLMKLLQALPPNDPLRAELLEQLVLIQNDDRLMVALQKVIEKREPRQQLEQVQEQLNFLVEKNKEQSTQIVNLKEQLAVTKQVASSVNLIRRNAVNATSKIREFVSKIKMNSQIEGERLKMEVEKALQEVEKVALDPQALIKVLEESSANDDVDPVLPATRATAEAATSGQQGQMYSAPEISQDENPLQI